MYTIQLVKKIIRHVKKIIRHVFVAAAAVVVDAVDRLSQCTCFNCRKTMPSTCTLKVETLPLGPNTQTH